MGKRLVGLTAVTVWPSGETLADGTSRSSTRGVSPPSTRTENSMITRVVVKIALPFVVKQTEHSQSTVKVTGEVWVPHGEQSTTGICTDDVARTAPSLPSGRFE
jgi:hypothetical protein